MFWIIFLGMIFIIPIPLLLEIIYEDNKLYIFFFKFKVYPSSKVIKSMPEPKADGVFPKLVYVNTFKYIWRRSHKYICGSHLKLNINLTYGFENAALTGIFSGIIQGSLAHIHNLLDSFFNITSFNSNIHPIFNSSLFKIRIKSIIFINLGKIIYISILVFKSFKNAAKYHLKPKEVG